MAAPKNIEELRIELTDAFDQVRKDPKRVFQVDAVVNAAGKIISSLKLELQYAELRKEMPDIEFLNYKNRKTMAPPKPLAAKA
jgi:hypothetical protein